MQGPLRMQMRPGWARPGPCVPASVEVPPPPVPGELPLQEELTRSPVFSLQTRSLTRGEEDLLHLRTLPRDPRRPAQEGLGGEEVTPAAQDHGQRRSRSGHW